MWNARCTCVTMRGAAAILIFTPSFRLAAAMAAWKCRASMDTSCTRRVPPDHLCAPRGASCANSRWPFSCTQISQNVAKSRMETPCVRARRARSCSCRCGIKLPALCVAWSECCSERMCGGVAAIGTAGGRAAPGVVGAAAPAPDSVGGGGGTAPPGERAVPGKPPSSSPASGPPVTGDRGGGDDRLCRFLRWRKTLAGTRKRRLPRCLGAVASGGGREAARRSMN
mmetsp:Transcript_38892/g.79539  ORF Transcript_38892/g.79539 Transcript_38892/m.79539 type:complete len:226 (-) Transcript_38892:698-1375(-)